MSALPIITVPDPILRQKSATVERVDDGLRKLMDDMLETMYLAPGVGLSAIQVAVPKRIVIVDIARDQEKPAPHFLINPEIVWSADEMTLSEEGCLSLPEQYAEVLRPAAVELAFVDYHGVAQNLRAEGMLATCLQHEIDHLDGRLFIDHISTLKRGMILRKLKKAKRQVTTA